MNTQESVAEDIFPNHALRTDARPDILNIDHQVSSLSTWFKVHVMGKLGTQNQSAELISGATQLQCQYPNYKVDYTNIYFII